MRHRHKQLTIVSMDQGASRGTQRKHSRKPRNSANRTNITQQKLYRSEEHELEAPPAVIALRDA